MTILTLTKENFTDVIEKNEFVIIDFWAEWCQPCHAFSKIFEEVAKKNTDLVFGKVNTEEQSELATEFNVRSIPLLIIMRKKVVLFSESGVFPANALQDLIDQAKALDMEEVLKNLRQESGEKK